MNNSRILQLGVMGLIIVGLGYFGWQGMERASQDVTPTATISTTATPFATVSYQGVEGKTAFELLTASHTVESQQFDFGVMIKSIDGKASDATRYWLYYVNGKMSTVGADKYVTKTSDTIEWRLEPAQQPLDY